MKKHLLAITLALSICNIEAGFDKRSMFHNAIVDSEWTYMENVFISGVKGIQAGEWKKVKRYVQGAVIGLLGYKWLESQKDDLFKLSDILNKGNLYAAATVWTAQEFGLPYLQKHLETQANAKMLVKFLQEWEINKPHTPMELHEAFENLVQILNEEGEEAIKKVTPTVISTMDFLIKRYFADRYLNSLDPREPAPSLKYDKAVGKVLTDALKAGKDLVK